MWWWRQLARWWKGQLEATARVAPYPLTQAEWDECGPEPGQPPEQLLTEWEVYLARELPSLLNR